MQKGRHVCAAPVPTNRTQSRLLRSDLCADRDVSTDLLEGGCAFRNLILKKPSDRETRVLFHDFIRGQPITVPEGIGDRSWMNGSSISRSGTHMHHAEEGRYAAASPSRVLIQTSNS